MKYLCLIFFDGKNLDALSEKEFAGLIDEGLAASSRTEEAGCGQSGPETSRLGKSEARRHGAISGSRAVARGQWPMEVRLSQLRDLLLHTPTPAEKRVN